MRISLALVVATALAGCGGGDRDAPPGRGDDTPDGGAKDAGIDADLGLQPPAQGFQLHSPTVDLNPGDDYTFCYYFHTPNKADLAIQQWESQLSDGVQGVVVYLTRTDLKTPGSLTTDGCGYTTTSVGPVWVYQSQIPRDRLAMPADDGSGTPVGLPLPAGQSGYLQMHMVNSTSAVIHAHVDLNADAYPDGTHVTEAGPFITYSTKINLGPGSTLTPATDTVSAKCTVPTTTKFFSMSTHTFRQGSHTLITDNTTTVFEGTDWQKPNDVSQIPPSFYSFASGKLTYQCDYKNPNNYRIVTGDNAATDEICVAVGYFFPSPGGAGAFCLDGVSFNQ